MTAPPSGYDLMFTPAARQDRRRLDFEGLAAWEALSAVLLKDPTLTNPLVSDLTNGEQRAVYLITAFEISAFFEFVNPLIIQIIHISPIPYIID